MCRFINKLKKISKPEWVNDLKVEFIWCHMKYWLESIVKAKLSGNLLRNYWKMGNKNKKRLETKRNSWREKNSRREKKYRSIQSITHG